MPVNTTQAFIGKKSAGTSGKLVMVESLFKDRLNAERIPAYQITESGLGLQSLQCPVYIFYVVNLPGKMIIPGFVTNEQTLIIRLFQFSYQCQTFQLL